MTLGPPRPGGGCVLYACNRLGAADPAQPGTIATFEVDPLCGTLKMIGTTSVGW